MDQNKPSPRRALLDVLAILKQADDPGNRGKYKYHVTVPRYVTDLPLSDYAFRLYGYIRYITDKSGKCRKSTKALAIGCGISEEKVAESKKELIEFGLIRVKKVHGHHGQFEHDEITTTDAQVKEL